MPLQAEWYIEKKIIVVKAIGQITADEIAHNLVYHREMVTAAEAEYVYVIYDAAKVTGVPPIRDLIRVLTTMPSDDRFRLTMLVEVESRLLSVTIGIASRLSGQLFRNFKTLDEALKFLKLYDPTLESELANIEE